MSSWSDRLSAAGKNSEAEVYRKRIEAARKDKQGWAGTIVGIAICVAILTLAIWAL